jgi:hypothetical protein
MWDVAVLSANANGMEPLRAHFFIDVMDHLIVVIVLLVDQASCRGVVGQIRVKTL